MEIWAERSLSMEGHEANTLLCNSSTRGSHQVAFQAKMDPMDPLGKSHAKHIDLSTLFTDEGSTNEVKRLLSRLLKLDRKRK